MISDDFQWNIRCLMVNTHIKNIDYQERNLQYLGNIENGVFSLSGYKMLIPLFRSINCVFLTCAENTDMG